MLPSDTHVTLSGDPADDDAAILNAQIESHAQPPTADKQPVSPISKPPATPHPPTRILSGTIVSSQNWGAVQLLPADPHRVSLTVGVTSALTTDFIRVADDLGKVQALGSSGVMYAGQSPHPIEGHTGPVWVSSVDVAGPVMISFIAVTR